MTINNKKKLKWIVLIVFTIILIIYAFVINPVVLHTDLAEGATIGVAPQMDWFSTLKMFAIYEIVVLGFWSVLFLRKR